LKQMEIKYCKSKKKGIAQVKNAWILENKKQD
jgi:hypothetical protein